MRSTEVGGAVRCALVLQFLARNQADQDKTGVRAAASHLGVAKFIKRSNYAWRDRIFGLIVLT